MNSDEWYCTKTETRQRIGPILAAQVAQLIQSGQLLDTDYVWKQGMENWAPISQMKSLFVEPALAPADDLLTGLPKLDTEVNLDDVRGISPLAEVDSGGPGEIKVDFDLDESIATRHPYPAGGLGGAGAVAVAGAGENAGFWLRLGAFVIDGLAMSCVTLPIAFVLLGAPILDAAISAWREAAGASNPADFQSQFDAALVAEVGGQRMRLSVITFVLLVAVPFLYGWLMEWSPLQATLGKLALGIRVTDASGDRLSLLHSLARNALKQASRYVPCVGRLIYVIAAWTPQKQALHDLVTKCLVAKK